MTLAQDASHGRQPARRARRPHPAGHLVANRLGKRGHTRRMANELDDLLQMQVTQDANMLHTRECPHLGRQALAALVPATEEQQEQLHTCSSCRDILDGGRRATFEDLGEAMEALPLPVENRARVREIAAELTYSQIWIPASRSYIAVAGTPGTAALAYINKGFVDIRRSVGGYDREVLPLSRAGGGRASGAVSRPRALCSRCYTMLPASGICDTCGD